MISEEQRSEIKRLSVVEKWPIGTIAAQLGLHRQTVAKALRAERVASETERKSILDPYLPIISEILTKYPRLSGSRIHQMILERGYEGSVRTLRKSIRELRPKSAKVFQDLHFLPGEVAQVDWADFGNFEVSPGVFRRLNCFVMTLAYSRKTFARFYYHQKMGAVLEGHVEAFEAFRGVPRRIVYDNMKTAVITNLGRGVEFNPSLLQMAGYYHFECVACTPRAAWQKGRVERTIRYIRDNFAPQSRHFRSIDDLNLQLNEWLYEVANKRSWPDDHNRYVNEVFEEEKERLLPLQPVFPFYDEVFCVVNKKSMIQFDCNLYTVPPQYGGQTLTVRATSGYLQVYSSENLIAIHGRSWSKSQKIIIPEHIDAVIVATKARPNYQNRRSIIKELKSGSKLIDEWVKIGESLSRQSRLVADLIAAYSAEAVDAAVELALEQGTPRAHSISHILIGQPRHQKPNFLRSDLDCFSPEKHDLTTYDYL